MKRSARPSRHKQPKPAPAPLECGVHFGLSMAAYHADPAISASDLRRLLQDPMIFWHRSPLNPNREEEPDTLAKLRGRAVHSLVLQGPQAFAHAFAEAPVPQPGDLVTAADMRDRCREPCLPVSGSKGELAKRIRSKQPDARVFDEVLAPLAEPDVIALHAPRSSAWILLYLIGGRVQPAQGDDYTLRGPV